MRGEFKAEIELERWSPCYPNSFPSPKPNVHKKEANPLTILTLILGMVVLTVGAELLVRSASRLATLAGISPLVVGLTVVAFGTSAPELVVSAQSAVLGQPDVALGNVLGSNIFNVLFILGVSALIVPLRVSIQLVRIEVPLMIAVSLLAVLFSLDGIIGKIDGVVLVAGLILYTYFSVIMSRRKEAVLRSLQDSDCLGTDNREALTSKSKSAGWTVDTVLLLVGLGLLVLGSRWFIDAAIDIARYFGASELIIGLTLVAAGTSLPEVATSILAAIRGERDIAVGNVVGSNLFNIMGVLGISSCIAPQGIPVSEAALWLDMPVMTVVAVACLPIFYTGHTIARWEGGLFLVYYMLYVVYLFLAEAMPQLTRSFQTTMIFMVIPLTAVTLLIEVYRHFSSANGKTT